MDRFGNMKRWGLKGMLAIGDQVILSGSNFLLSVLLARWLSAGDFGVFAVCFAVYLLIIEYHNSLVLDPISIVGPSQYPGIQLPGYLRSQVVLHFATLGIPAVCLSILGTCLSLLTSESRMGQALLVLGLTLPFSLLQPLARRFLYVLGSPGSGLVGSGLYAMSVVAAVLVLRMTDLLQAATAPLPMAIGGVVSGIAILFRAGVRTQAIVPLRAVVEDHWRIGKYLLARAALAWLAAQASPIVVSWAIDLNAAGALRAMQVVSVPAAQVTFAMAVLMLPVLSADSGSRNRSAMMRKARIASLVPAAITLVYCVTLASVSPWLERLLFGGKFESYAWLIPVMALGPIAQALGIGPSLILRIERPDWFLKTTLVASPLGLIASAALTLLFGIEGAALGLCLSSLIVTGLTVWYARSLGFFQRDGQALSDV